MGCNDSLLVLFCHIERRGSVLPILMVPVFYRCYLDKRMQTLENIYAVTEIRMDLKIHMPCMHRSLNCLYP